MRNPKAIVITVALFLSVAFCELSLRLAGYRPGIFRSLGGFTIVDSLILYRNFITDEAGIYKFSPWLTDSMPLHFDRKTGEIDNDRVKQNICHLDNLDYVTQSFLRLSDSEAANNIKWRIKRWQIENNTDSSEFVHAYKLILEKTISDDWATSFLEYSHHPFNQDGFRSIPFRSTRSKRKKILLIGDSFVYGMSARPAYNSFPDILLARGYVVYSAGIPGTDPSQYAAIAQKYIPALSPDIVILCFYEGNDYMKFARIVSATEPPEHITNAGFFNSAPYGVYLNPKQAYDHYKIQVAIPDITTDRFNRTLSLTAIGSLIWGGAYKMHLVSDRQISATDSMQAIMHCDTAFTMSRIHLIDSICSQYHSLLVPVVIPEKTAPHNQGKDNLIINEWSADRVFKGIKYFYPRDMNKQRDFPKNDYHFNNAGSTKFANFLDTLIHDTSL